jgi:hypothetical protein
MEKIPDTDSFLLIISPNSEYFNFWSIFWFLVKLIGIIIAIRILISIVKYVYPYFEWFFNIIL